MEEYRDLDLTVTAFREVLDEPEFHRALTLVRPATVPEASARSERAVEGPPRLR